MYPASLDAMRWSSLVFAGFLGASLDGGRGVLLGGLVTIIGASLNAAFRSKPGDFSLAWREIRRKRSPELHRFYSVAGPYLVRAGVACVAVAAVSEFVRRSAL